MDNDNFTAESGETASVESAEPAAEGFPETADRSVGDDGSERMLGSSKDLSIGNALVRIGGAIMALSTLFSWVKAASDSFPNVAGVGGTTFGVGLTVFVLGLSLLLRPWSVAVTLGKALGTLGIILVYVSLIGTSGGTLAIGSWIGLAGSSVAVSGAIVLAGKSDQRPDLKIDLMPAALGATLAVIASFWLDWMLNIGILIFIETNDAGPLSGLDPDVLFGIPILILGVISLIFILELVAVPRIVLGDKRQLYLTMCRVAGITITVIAGSNLVGMMLLGIYGFGSGPLVALVGGLLITRSIREGRSLESLELSDSNGG